jgi:hypothetical protein
MQQMDNKRAFFSKLNKKLDSRSSSSRRTKLTYEHITGTGPTKIHKKLSINPNKEDDSDMTGQITQQNYHFKDEPKHSRPSTATKQSTTSTKIVQKQASSIERSANDIKVLVDTVTGGLSPIDQASEFMKDYLLNNQMRYKSRSVLKGEGLLYVPPPPPPIPSLLKP